MIEVAGAIVYRGKAYLHVEARIKGDGFLAVEPVFISDLTIEGLTAAFERVIAAGHPLVRMPSRLEMQLHQDPILKATGAKSWKELAAEAASYTVVWSNSQITLYISRLDEQARFEIDPDKTKTFALDTPLQKLVEVILKDITSRSNLSYR